MKSQSRTGCFLSKRARQRGFSLIEVMISMFVLTVGLVSLLGVMALAMASTQTSQENAMAKQVADEAMEGIFTARETSNLSWNSIQNTGGGGVFVAGFVPVLNPGPDGIIGTADDGTGPNPGPQTLQLPGPDGIFGTADDVFVPLTNYTRQIAINPVFDATGSLIPTLRSVTITVQYTTSQSRAPKQYVLNTFISQYR